ncbi:MAG: DNA mismatch endonuclease Vsr [Terriglobia bacterium]|jgi:DNA mismatch endonuclease (patch repair protein)
MKSSTTSPNRSRLMASVRQRGSAPELAVRAILRGQRHRFKTNAERLPGSPDIYAPWAKLAVFIHGCFWHRHRGCRACTTPKNHRNFWLEKFRQNVARDRRKVRQLRRLGYRVLTVWECQVKSLSKLARLKKQLDRFFGGNGWGSLQASERSPLKTKPVSSGAQRQPQQSRSVSKRKGRRQKFFPFHETV